MSETTDAIETKRQQTLSAVEQLKTTLGKISVVFQGVPNINPLRPLQEIATLSGTSTNRVLEIKADCIIDTSSRERINYKVADGVKVLFTGELVSGTQITAPGADIYIQHPDKYHTYDKLNVKCRNLISGSKLQLPKIVAKENVYALKLDYSTIAANNLYVDI